MKQPLLSLTKENFWNALTEKYPVEMTLFTNWIDEYKKRVNWDDLFNGGLNRPVTPEARACSRKYHDLPIAMQVGIFIQFTMEEPFRDSVIKFVNVYHMDGFADHIKDWFENQHDKVN